MTYKPPAPRGFIPAEHVQWAKLHDHPPGFLNAFKRKPTGRRWKGIKYERLVHEYLYQLFPHRYVASPWIQFEGANGVKWCQPDGLLFDFDAGQITLIEVKYQHTSDAWWQMRRLYLPPLELLFPRELWTIRTLEVVKWYDPNTVFPEPLKMIAELDVNLPIATDETGLHIWRP